MDPPVPPDLYSSQEGHPSWFPLVPSDWGIWASPQETDQDSCPGWLPPVALDLVSPQEGFSPSPLTPRFKCFPATRILPIISVLFVFCVVPNIEPLCENAANWKSLLTSVYIFRLVTTLTDLSRNILFLQQVQKVTYKVTCVGCNYYNNNRVHITQ